MEWVRVFNSTDSTTNEIENVGEQLLLFQYGATSYNISLDNLRYILFQKSFEKIASKLESMPSKSSNGAHHSFRAYYEVQDWRGNKKPFPEQWGWMRLNGDLQSAKTTLELAPYSIPQLISCACKRNCSTLQCTCLKSGVKSFAICKVCEGDTRQNHNYEDSLLSGNDEDTHVTHLHQADDNTDSEREYD